MRQSAICIILNTTRQRPVVKKDELRYNYGIIRCGAALFDQLDKEDVLAYRKDDYQWNVLVADKEKARRKYKNAVVDDATIDDILLLYVKGEQAK